MMAKFENLKNKNIKKSLHPKFLSDFKNVGTKIFVKSISINVKKKKWQKDENNWVKNFRNAKNWGFLGFFGQNWKFWVLFFFSLLAETYLNTEILIPKSSKSVKNLILYDFF